MRTEWPWSLWSGCLLVVWEGRLHSVLLHLTCYIHWTSFRGRKDWNWTNQKKKTELKLSFFSFRPFETLPDVSTNLWLFQITSFFTLQYYRRDESVALYVKSKKSKTGHRTLQYNRITHTGYGIWLLYILFLHHCPTVVQKANQLPKNS